MTYSSTSKLFVKCTKASFFAVVKSGSTVNLAHKKKTCKERFIQEGWHSPNELKSRLISTAKDNKVKDVFTAG